jgi:phosphoenolpyruvate carboxylase
LSNKFASRLDLRLLVQFYSTGLVDPELQPFGDTLFESFMLAKKMLLQTTGHANPLGAVDHALLQEKLSMRAPYITPLNILQVHAHFPSRFFAFPTKSV